MRAHFLLTLTAIFGMACGGFDTTNPTDGGYQDAGDAGTTGDGGDFINTGPFAPVAKHVGATGLTCCMTAVGKTALYIFVTATGGQELHYVDGSGADHTVTASVNPGGYSLSPDGTGIFYLTAANGSSGLSYAPTSAPEQSKVLLTSGLTANQPLIDLAFFSPSGKYLITGAATSTAARAQPDLYAYASATGAQVYHLGLGAFDYLEVVTNDDTMIFQNDVGGTVLGTPPVQTLFAVPLATAATATPATIDTHTANFTVSADQKTVYYTKTAGGLYAYNLAAKTTTPLSATAVSFAVSATAGGPVAYTQLDGSVHLLNGSTDSATPAHSADLLSTVQLSADNTRVYFFQTIDTQDNQGTLFSMSAAATTPLHIADKVSLVDLHFIGTEVIYLSNVDALGATGTANLAHLDGSGVVSLGMTVPKGFIETAVGTHNSVAALTGSAMDANTPANGSEPVLGTLSLSTDYAAAVSVGTAPVHTFTFADDALALAYADGAFYSKPVLAYLGNLFIYDIVNKAALDVKLSGVSELGPITHRALLVDAPGAKPAGLYKITY